MRLVEWRDSNIYQGQSSIYDTYEVAIVKSIGFMIHKDKDKIALAGDVIDNDVRRIISIPYENIISIKKLN